MPESDDFFGDLDRQLAGTILRDARAKDEHVCLVIAVLVLPDGSRRLLHYDEDYGDGEGTNNVVAMVRTVHSNSMLEDGERIEVATYSIPLEVLLGVALLGGTVAELYVSETRTH